LINTSNILLGIEFYKRLTYPPFLCYPLLRRSSLPFLSALLMLRNQESDEFLSYPEESSILRVSTLMTEKEKNF
jgi:hypothetical protein